MTTNIPRGQTQLRRERWRERVLGRYLRKKITRAEAIESVGLDWVEQAERQHKAMRDDMEWALKG